MPLSRIAHKKVATVKKAGLIFGAVALVVPTARCAQTGFAYASEKASSRWAEMKSEFCISSPKILCPSRGGR